MAGALGRLGDTAISSLKGYYSSNFLSFYRGWSSKGKEIVEPLATRFKFQSEPDWKAKNI